MQLSRRLAAIAAMVNEGNRIVDVGCDHGYIPIWLVEQKKIPGAIAMDIRPGPLLRAEENIRQHGLSPYIETRLSDGVTALASGEGETLVIAGMGGPLTERILENGWEVVKDFSELILEPQSEISRVRRWLISHKFEIQAEELIYEDGKYYPVIKAVPGNPLELSEAEAEYGPCLLKQKACALKQFLEKELILCDTLSEKLSKSLGERAERRREEISGKRKLILSALKYFETDSVY